jgi:hypothetical protein
VTVKLDRAEVHLDAIHAQAVEFIKGDDTAMNADNFEPRGCP